MTEAPQITDVESHEGAWIGRTVLCAEEVREFCGRGPGITFDVVEHPHTVIYFLPADLLARRGLTIADFQTGRHCRYHLGPDNGPLDDIELDEPANILDGIRARAHVLADEVMNGPFGVHMTLGVIRDAFSQFRNPDAHE